MNPVAMRSFNAIELLEIIRTNGRLSRSGLAVLSRLSKPTVSGQVDALIARGLVVEVGTGKASARGGKKPTLIEFNASHGRILCVEVGPEWVRFASADLKGSMSSEIRLPTRPEKGAQAALKTIKSGIADLLKRDTTRTTAAKVISVAVPGIVDVRDGVVRETDNVFSWTDFKLGPELTAAFGIPAYIDNDVNMAALAELNAAGGPPASSFVLIRLNTGIGAGVVLNGRLHHGSHWAAGEIGHMVLDTAAGERPPGPRGYLESVVGADRVAERLRSGNHGGRTAKRVRAQMVHHLGCAIANIAAAYDPEVVILLGDTFPPLLEEVRDVARKLVPWPVEIRMSTLGEDAALRGALAAGMTRAFEQIAASLQSETD
jgi:predicted NBD/HSP70 family sugar kinase